MALDSSNGNVSQEEKRRVRKIIQNGRDYAPSVRNQSAHHVNWAALGETLGQPFDATKIPLSKLYQMRRDPMIAFALQFIKVPLIRSQWYIKAEDPQVAAFVDYALRKIFGRYVLQHTQSLDFGYAGIVKRFEKDKPQGFYIDPDDPDKVERPIWDEGNIDAVVWKNFVGIRPEIVDPRWNRSGEFNGLTVNNSTGTNSGFPFQSGKEGEVNVPLEFALWVTNERDSVFGSIWGYPRTGYAYRYWWSYWYRWALADRHYEKDADPPLVVYYPDSIEDRVIDDVTGEEINLREIALSLGEQARSGSTIAAPGGMITGFDDRPTTTREWEFKFLEGGSNFNAFTESFEYLDIQKIRSIFLPEQAFFEGRGGTSSRNVAGEMGDLFEKSQAVLMQEIDETLNRWVIPQLVHVNFPEYKGRVEKITRGFGDEDMEMAKQLVTLIGQSDPTELSVDVRKILEELGVPVLSFAEIERRKQEAIEQAQAMAPPTVDPVAGEAAGTTPTQPSPATGGQPVDTGFAYVKPRGLIHLAEDEEFILELPDSVHYSDAQVRSATRQLRKLWADAYASLYEGFADYVAKTDLAEMNFDEHDDLADRLVDGFAAFGPTASDLAEKSVGILRGVIKRASEVVADKAEFAEKLEPDTETVAQWLEEHGALMVRAIDETTRDELRRFLAGEVRAGKSAEDIALGVREHFAEFPGWKANRLARTEIKDAWNMATLLTADLNGIKRVQASDASDGTDHATDEECKRRHGKVFTIPEAVKVVDHPNGTLEWRILRANLSVEYVDELEGLGEYDPETETVYLRSDIEPEAEAYYMDAIGRRLS